MARYGLRQVDLNLLAQLALHGLSRLPEADIVNLLRSEQPIERETRDRLADALEGGPGRLTLKAIGKQPMKVFNAFQLRRDRLATGRDVLSRIPDIGYDEAILDGATRHPMGQKSLAAAVAFARKVEAWIQSIRLASGPSNDLSDFALEVVYLYADATERDPMSCLRPSARDLAILLEFFDERRASATGLRPARSGPKPG